MEAESSKGPRKEEVLYCVCKSKDDKRFMICCDSCNQWFHGDCVDVKADQAKKIKHYYCQKCRDEKKLSIVYKKSPTSLSTDSEHEPFKKKTKADSCGDCIGCFRTEDCGKCIVCISNIQSAGAEKKKCRLRCCVNYTAPPVYKPIKPKESPRLPDFGGTSNQNASVKLKNVPKKKPTTRNEENPMQFTTTKISAGSAATDTIGSVLGVIGGTTRAGAKAYKSFIAEAGLAYEDDRGDELRQCLGPGCILPARRGSKYCSDETCGLKLARARILEILPGRLQQWNAQPTIAEEFERRRLDQIEAQMDDAKKVLDDLAAEEEKLNKWLQETTNVQWDGRTETDNDDDEGNNIYCPTCGHETSSKSALRHINRCFSKYENQTSFGSANRTFNNIYQIFCDTFNKTSGTYCKRLRVICPEHHKEAKISDQEICGASLPSCDNGPSSKRLALLNGDLKLGSEFCRAQKKNCPKHYKWEKVRRAVLDTERLSQLLKVDELYDEQRALRAAQKARGGVLALLLHQTIIHQDGEQTGAVLLAPKAETSSA